MVMKIIIVIRVIIFNNNNCFVGEFNIVFFFWDREFGEEYLLVCMMFCFNN